MNNRTRILDIHRTRSDVAPRPAPPANGGFSANPASDNGASANGAGVLLNASARELPAAAHAEPATCDVVIPYCRTNLRWLAASVESILNQVGVECVVHLIADGFDVPDDPARQFADLPNVRWYRNAEPIGPYRSTNRIADRLETQSLAIQDSDDIALPHRIAFSLEQMRAQNAEMFGGAMRQFTSFESRDRASVAYVRQQPVHASGRYAWDVSPDGVVINGTRVMTVELFRRMNGFAPFLMSADCEFTTRALRAGAAVAFSNEIVALRRVHGGSLSRGRVHGIGSRTRDLCHARMKASFALMTPGFDPKRFGGIENERKQSDLTQRVGGRTPRPRETFAAR